MKNKGKQNSLSPRAFNSKVTIHLAIMNLPAPNSNERSRVLVLGAGGHDGPFLCRILSEQFSVVGYSRKHSQRLVNTGVETISGEISQYESIKKLISLVRPDIVVNLISVSSVFECEANPALSNEVNYQFVKYLYSALVEYSDSAHKRPQLLQASSSEIFGNSKSICDESTPLRPVSQYGLDKARAHEFLEEKNSKVIDIKRAILFNHESEHRDPRFVSQKIANAAAKFRLGIKYELKLGNTSSSRDWGYAPDYMQAISLLLNNPGDETCVIASGELHSVEDLIRTAFNVNSEYELSNLYSINDKLMRKNDTGALRGSNERIREIYGWQPKVPFSEMVQIMVDYQMRDIVSSQKERECLG